MRQLAARFALFAVAAWTAVAVHANPIVYAVELSGPAESPPNSSPGTGSAIVTYDPVAHTLGLDIDFSGLLGTTTASHIHCCTAVPDTGTVGVATTTPTFAGFPLGVTSGTYIQVLDLTQATSWNPAFVTANGSIAGAESTLAAGLAAERAYLNIHTSQFGGGEIRGFVRAVPEPATLALLALGVAGLGFSRRKRQ